MAEEAEDDYQLEEETAEEIVPAQAEEPKSPRAKQELELYPNEKEKLDEWLEMFTAGKIGWRELKEGIDETLYFYDKRRELQAKAEGYTSTGEAIITLSQAELEMMQKACRITENYYKDIMREKAEKLKSMKTLGETPEGWFIRQIEDYRLDMAKLMRLGTVVEAFLEQAREEAKEQEQKALEGRTHEVKKEADKWDKYRHGEYD